MARGKLCKQSGGSLQTVSTYPSNKFSILSSCVSWSNILAIITIVVLVGVAYAMTVNHQILMINGSNPNEQHEIMMIENDISNNPRSSRNVYEQDRVASHIPMASTNKQFDNTHLGTGTPVSERIRYQVNPVIRDVISYEQNPNIVSIGRYEAQKNMERVINPLLPPERSYVSTYGIPINIPSRGPFQAYQQVGILSKENIVDPDKIPGNNNESNILPLFGRPTYNGSNRWNYYTSSDKFQSVKLPINIDNRKCTDDLGCDELRDGDMVTIPSYNGRFKVEIYDFDKPRYIPFVY
jgi:hypothetical protein